MVKRIALSKWFGICFGILFAGSLLFQAWQLYRFVHAGARFTANDGQALCERIQKLEPHPATCQYTTR